MKWFTDGDHIWNSGHRKEMPIHEAKKYLNANDSVTTIDAKRHWATKEAFLSDSKVRQWIYISENPDKAIRIK